MKKRIAAVLLAVTCAVTGFCVPVGADTMVNLGGYWSPYYSGLRFSLVAPDNLDTPEFDGYTKKTIDIFNYDFDSLLDSKGVDTGWTGGGVENVLNANANGKSRHGYIKFEYRILNQCKLDIARDLNYDPDDHVRTSAPVLLKKGSIGKTDDPWYCANKDDIFIHSPVTRENFNTRLIEIEGNTFYFTDKHGNRTDDRRYSFLNTWMKENLISDGNKKTNEFKGICDLLQAFGLNIYSSGDSTPNSELYANVVTEFVIPNYAIVVEPIYFLPITSYEKYYNADGETKFKMYSVVIYYGSTTELSYIASHPRVLSGRQGMLDVENSSWRYAHSDDYGYVEFSRVDISMSGIVNGLGMKTAYLNNDYREELLLYTGNGAGSIKPIEDSQWDFYSYYLAGDYDSIPEECKNGQLKWTPSNYGNETQIRNMLNGICALGASKTFQYSTDYTKNHACGMTMLTSSDIIKPTIEAFDYKFPTDTEVVSSVEIRNKSLDEPYLPTTDTVSSTTVVNSNGVPVSMVCEFTIESFSVPDESGVYENTYPAYVEDPVTGEKKMSDIAKEMFYTDDDGNVKDNVPVTYYSAIDGIASFGEIIDNNYADCYASVNWITPLQPCRVSFRVVFNNADMGPEPALGTVKINSRSGNRETKVDYDTVKGEYYTTFECVIDDNFQKTVSDIEMPNPVSITSVEPASSTTDPKERSRYEQSVATRDAYFEAAEISDVLYNGSDFVGYTQSLEHEWAEYVSRYNGGEIVLDPISHRVKASVANDESVTYSDGAAKVIRTDINGLYEPYSDELASGYGFGIDFTAYFNSDALSKGYRRDVTIGGVAWENKIVLNYQHGAVLLPEYLYKDYYGEIEPVETEPIAGKELLSRYCLTENENSVYYESETDGEKSRVHFTPVWYPDGKYQIVVCMTDAYTPVGQLWYYRTYDIEIKGSIYDTWYITRTNNY